MEPLLRDPQPSRISALNAGEVVDVMTRIFGRSPDAVLDALTLLEVGGLELVPVSPAIGIDAGRLHARFYDRRTSQLSMADCVALATASELGEALATSDPPLAAAARSLEIAVIALPDSRGRRPEQ